MWDVLLYMCCFYWLMNKAVLANGLESKARQEIQAEIARDSRLSQGDAT